MKILVLLPKSQNRPQYYPSWIEQLSKSRTGTQLKKILGKDCFSPLDDVVYADDSSSLRDYNVNVVLACGKEPERAALAAWKGPLLIIPHIGLRTLKNDVLESAKRILSRSDYTSRLAIRQTDSELSMEYFTIYELREATSVGTYFADIYMNDALFARDIDRRLGEAFVKEPWRFQSVHLDVPKMRTYMIEGEYERDNRSERPGV